MKQYIRRRSYATRLHYCDELSKAKTLYLQGGEAIKQGLALFDLEWRNIEAGQTWAAACAAADNQAAELCNRFPLAGVYLLDLRQHAREHVKWLKSGLTAARQLKRRADEGVHLGNLGLAYAVLGETRQAIEFYEQRLVIAREIGDRRGEGNVLFNMSLALDTFGEGERAIPLMEAALKIYEQIESPAAQKVRNKLAKWCGQSPESSES